MDCVDRAIEVLNRLHKADPNVLDTLVFVRVPCNKQVADDPTIQVMGRGPDKFVVGVLGIINGLFGVNDHGWGYIQARTDDGGNILEFVRTEVD